MKNLHAHYHCSSRWDLEEIFEELGITDKDVVEYHVEYDTLTLTYRSTDGICKEEFEANKFSASDDFQWQNPSKLVLETDVEEIEL